MVQDLHAHTYYSFCGKDTPEAIVEAAIAGGVELFGICDHNYGIGHGRECIFRSESESLYDEYELTLRRYYDHINLIREKYADRIKIMRGIEIATDLGRRRAALPMSADISYFDYCLVESLEGVERSSLKGDLFSFAERCGCPVGIAHTDLFAFIQKIGGDPVQYFARMAEHGIFWEMNVSYDSIHNYREHGYVLRFWEDTEQQRIVRESGVKLSVGFDGHRVEDYRPDRVKEACERIRKMGIGMIFEA